MTEQDILNMKPGKDLDTLVEEYIIGNKVEKIWCFKSPYNGCWWPHTNVTEEDKQDTENYSIQPCVKHSNYYENLEDYSTDDGSAVYILRIMAKEGYEFEIGTTEEAGGWYSYIHKDDLFGPHSKLVSGEFAEAVCKSVLIAKLGLGTFD